MSDLRITMVVDHLERRGLARRRRGPEDRRVVTVRLTGAGRRLIRRIFPRHVRAIVHEMKILAPGEQEALRVLCWRVGTRKQEGGHA